MRIIKVYGELDKICLYPIMLGRCIYIPLLGGGRNTGQGICSAFRLQASGSYGMVGGLG